MRTPERTCRRGFTLVEILVVVLILGIVAALVVPNIGTAAESQVISAARVLQSHLETARSMALTTQQPHALVFNESRSAYKIVRDYDGSGYDGADAIEHPVRRGQAFVVELDAENGLDMVTVTAVTFDDGDYVSFDDKGTASSNGSIDLQAGSFATTVEVQALTGYVSVSDGS